jgi:hypothetical protein
MKQAHSIALKSRYPIPATATQARPSKTGAERRGRLPASKPALAPEQRQQKNNGERYPENPQQHASAKGHDNPPDGTDKNPRTPNEFRNDAVETALQIGVLSKEA